MDKNSVMRNPIIQQSTEQARKSSLDLMVDKVQAGNPNGFPHQSLIPEDAVYGWNQKNEAAQNYDPFEKVVLVKGIDNSILTSFRTLKRENNTVSDTFKVVHQKFLPQKNNGQYFKLIQKNQADKLGLYPHTDNEDALDYAHAELLAESLMHHQEEAEGSDQPA